MTEFTHLGNQGGVHMVDVSSKPSSARSAVVEGVVHLGSDAYHALIEQRIVKGDVLTTAQIAGIMGAKETARLIPMCHPVQLDSVDITFSFDEHAYAVKIQATATSYGRTGVEMEALTAVSIASLAIYDMCKSISKAIRITDIRLISKEGGVHGSYSAHHVSKTSAD